MKSLSEIGKFRDSLSLDGLTNDDIFNIAARYIAPKFELNENNTEFYKQLKFYFNNDTRFDGDLTKGLLIIGGYGTGKTVAMEIFRVYNLLCSKNRSFVYYDNDMIIDAFTKEGRPSIERFNYEYSDILIDELGEDSGKHYYFGSIEDPVEVLLGRRYNAFKAYGGRTHAISNLDPKMLQNRFSGKIYDRICEMFNIVPLTGESWRRK